MNDAVMEISTVAEIDMECMSCEWEGTQADCSAVDPSEVIRGKVTSRCPKCGGTAVQSFGGKFKFRKPERTQGKAGKGQNIAHSGE